MIITLGGRLGAGKSTIAGMLRDRLGYEIISIGGIKRKLAADMGLTILEFDKIGRENPEKAKEYDLKYEEYQQGLDLNKNIVLDSKLGFFCQPNAFKVFLQVDDMEGARRIYEAQREDDENASLEAVLAVNTTRQQGMQDTYKKLYSIDLLDESNYTLVVDTTHITAEEVYQKIIHSFDKFKLSI